VNSVGESSSVPSQSDIQNLLTPKHWEKQYITAATNKSGAKKANEDFAKLKSNPGKNQPDYWVAYSGGKNARGKPQLAVGTPRTHDEVKNLIKDSSDLNKELDLRKNQPSLILYKSLPTSRKNPDGTYTLGGHFGDYEQAEKYYKGNQGQQQTMLKITLKPGAHELLFSPKYMALSPTGKQHRTIAELSKLENKGPYPLTKNNGEGTLGGYIGLKPEGDSGFSLGFTEGNNASEALFNHFVGTIEEGRPGNDGKWEPNS
jgi:hypothetical protein